MSDDTSKNGGFAAVFSLIRIALGVALIVYAVAKIPDPAVFLKSVRQYGILPEDPPYMLNLSAVVIPWLELVGGLLLVLGLMRRGSAAVLGTLLVVFTTAIVLRTFEIRDTEGTPFCEIIFDCGCGSGEVLICDKLILNGLLIAACAVTMLVRRDPWTIGRLLSKRSDQPAA